MSWLILLQSFLLGLAASQALAIGLEGPGKQAWFLLGLVLVLTAIHLWRVARPAPREKRRPSVLVVCVVFQAPGFTPPNPKSLDVRGR
jgi:hypothetical protein